MGLGAAAAALWIGLLWYAAPLAGGDDAEPADRVAGVLVLGVLLTAVLGFAHLLGAPAVWLATIGLALVRRARGARATSRAWSRSDRLALALVAGVTVAAAWPALARPLLEGDSLSYHLPNAATWVRDGSLWDTNTRYWWYPGGSELFAAALYAVSGSISLGLAGTLAALLLGLRIVAWARRAGAPPLLGAAVAAATIAAPSVGLQAGNLQNDVWLAAFFLELLYDLRFASRKLWGDAAVCVLVKPSGWAFAALALLSGASPGLRVAIPLAVLACWALRDALLWPHALISPASVAYPGLAQTTVLNHGISGVAEFARVLALDDPWLFALGVAPLIGIVALRDRRLCAAGIVALVAFFALPFSFRDALPQLANGQSLRFALPAFAVGAVVATQLLRRVPAAAVVALLGLAAFGLAQLFRVFWIDPNTHYALLAAAVLALAVALPPARAMPALASGVALLLAIAAGLDASRDRTARYDELLLPAHTRVFEWLATAQPARIVTSDVPAGAVVAISPATKVFDVVDPAPCDEARALGAELLFRTVPPPEKSIYPSAVWQFAHCGPVVYEDEAVRVVRPAPSIP